ncbi:MAG: Uncharacterized protein LiPW16_393 [Microgenomates group bacterium LiPW_16]|nr:MAG: Uncharacterized protein LiPW16_393 [Microgenomates group bacterium LiPW_16]
MSREAYLLTALIIAGLAIVFYLLNKKLGQIQEATKPDETLKEWVKSEGERSQKMSEEINQRLDNAARVIGAVQKNIGEMSEIGRGMKDLQEFLRSPKLRGNIGEQVLKELLGQMLPKQSFNLQYAFRSGAKVDAAIKTAAGIIPVDAKFPMENFRKMMVTKTEEEKEMIEKAFVKDVKNHIDDISSKYILTEEGTIDYALMYLPSEAVYYEVVNNSDLFDYSGKKRVLPVSGTTFYAYLRAILMSFEGQKIEAKARQILAAIRAVQKDYNKVDENLGILGKHIQNAYNQMSNVMGGFTLLGQKLSSTQALGTGEKEETKQLEMEE